MYTYTGIISISVCSVKSLKLHLYWPGKVRETHWTCIKVEKISLLLIIYILKACVQLKTEYFHEPNTKIKRILHCSINLVSNAILLIIDNFWDRRLLLIYMYVRKIFVIKSWSLRVIRKLKWLMQAFSFFPFNSKCAGQKYRPHQHPLRQIN